MITIKEINQDVSNNFEPILKISAEFNLDNFKECLYKDADLVEKEIGEIILSELNKYCKETYKISLAEKILNN